jgi:hypothetical protein
VVSEATYDKIKDRVVAKQPKSALQFYLPAVRPRCSSSASIFGSRPRNAR